MVPCLEACFLCKDSGVGVVSCVCVCTHIIDSSDGYILSITARPALRTARSPSHSHVLLPCCCCYHCHCCPCRSASGGSAGRHSSVPPADEVPSTTTPASIMWLFALATTAATPDPASRASAALHRRQLRPRWVKSRGNWHFSCTKTVQMANRVVESTRRKSRSGVSRVLMWVAIPSPPCPPPPHFFIAAGH